MAGRASRAKASAASGVECASRSISQGEVVRVYNARGACLAAACLSDQVRPGVLQMATSALSCLVEVQRFVGDLPQATAFAGFCSNSHGGATVNPAQQRCW